MSIEVGLVSALLADGGVSAIIGTNVFPGVIPDQSNPPGIVYNRFDSTREQQLTGASSMIESRFSLDCWSNTYSQAKSLADAVRAALEGTGVNSPATWDGVRVLQVYLETERDFSEFEGDRADYRISQDWVVLHEE